MAAAEAAKSLVAFVQASSRASITAVSARAGRLLAVCRALAHPIRTVPVGAREFAETGVVLGKTCLDLARYAEGSSGGGRGQARGGGRRGRGRSCGHALLLDVGGRVVGVELEVIGVSILAHRSALSVGADNVLAVAPGA